MATHEELNGLFHNDDLLKRLVVAICIKARAVLAAGVPASAMVWAAGVFEPTTLDDESDRMLRYLLAGCSAMTVQQIKDTADEELNAAVSAAVDQLFGEAPAFVDMPPPPSTYPR